MMRKQVKFLDEVQVFQMPEDFRDEILETLFYSPQDILKFQDERFEEEALELELKRAEEKKERKAQKAEKKRQRRERLHARKEARKQKRAASTSPTGIGRNSSRSRQRRTATSSDAACCSSDTDSEYWMLSTSASDSSSESEEMTTLPQELPKPPAAVKSPQRPFPKLDLDAQSPCKRRHSFPASIAALAAKVNQAKAKVKENENKEEEVLVAPQAQKEANSSSSSSSNFASPTKTNTNKKSPHRKHRIRRSPRSDMSALSCDLPPMQKQPQSDPLLASLHEQAPPPSAIPPLPKLQLLQTSTPPTAMETSNPSLRSTPSSSTSKATACTTPSSTTSTVTTTGSTPSSLSSPPEVCSISISSNPTNHTPSPVISPVSLVSPPPPEQTTHNPATATTITITTPVNTNMDEEEEDKDPDLEAMESLLATPTNANTTAATTTTETTALTATTTTSSTSSSSTATTMEVSSLLLQRDLRRWKQSTMVLFGLLILSWAYFSVAIMSTSTSTSTTRTTTTPSVTTFMSPYAENKSSSSFSPSTVAKTTSLRGSTDATKSTTNPPLVLKGDEEEEGATTTGIQQLYSENRGRLDSLN